MQALIPLALEGTDVGKVKAAHALAKIAAVSNPDMAFPGERVGVWRWGGIGQWEGSPLFLGAFLLVTLLLAWEGHGGVTERAMTWRRPASRPSSGAGLWGAPLVCKVKGRALLLRISIKVQPDPWVDKRFGNSKAGHL